MNESLQETGIHYLIRSAVNDTKKLIKQLEVGTRKTTELRIRFLADRISRAFWLAYMGTLSPEVEESFALAQEAQLVLNKRLRKERLENWDLETREDCLAYFTRLLIKTTPISERRLDGCF